MTCHTHEMNALAIVALLFITACSSSSTNESAGGSAGTGASGGVGVGGAAGSGGSGGSAGNPEDSGAEADVVTPDAGSDAEPEAGDAGSDSGSDAGCTEGSAKCVGSNVEICTGGTWQFTQTCPYVCKNNACGGSCVPGTKGCVAQSPKTCGTDGEWVFSAPCSYTCQAGECKGLCNPTELRCNGNGVEKCGTDGLWHPELICPFTCLDPGLCGGVCLPGKTQCNGLQTQLCLSSGQWFSTGTCPFVCSNATCTGVCTPGTSKCVGNGTQTCSSSGQWGSTVSCPFLCSNGSCAGVCTPGATKCNGTNVETCNPSGQWVVSQTCPGVPNGTAKCIGTGTCSFDCTSGYADCNASAGCETQLGTTSNCKSCGDACPAGGPNTTAVCNGITQGCSTNCVSGYGDCDGNTANGCEDNLQSPLNCGVCGKKCCAACSSGSCVPGSLNLTSSVVRFDVNDTTIYWSDSTNSTIYSRPLSGGSTTTVAMGQTTVSWITTTAPSGIIWANQGTYNPSTGTWVGGGVYLNGSTVSGLSAFWAGWDGTNIYWTDSGGYVKATPTGGQLLPGQFLQPNGGYSAAFTGGSMYFVALSDVTKVQKAVMPSGAPTAFVAVAGQKYMGPVTDGTWIYYIVTAPDIDKGIWKKAVSSGTPTKVYPAVQAASNWISTDGTWVYWFDSTGVINPAIDPYKVMKVSVNGGSAIQLATIMNPWAYPHLNTSCVYGRTGLSVIGMEK